MSIKKSILLISISTTIIFANNSTDKPEKRDLESIIKEQKEDITRLNQATALLITKINQLTTNQKMILKKLNLKEIKIKEIIERDKKKREEYAKKLLELKKLKEENKKAELELKEYIKNKVEIKGGDEDLSVSYKKNKKVEPTPEPKKVEVKSEAKKVEPTPEPKKVEVKSEPKKVEPTPEPKKAEVKSEDKKVEPTPKPKKVEVKSEAKKVEPTPEPKKIEKVIPATTAVIVSNNINKEENLTENNVSKKVDDSNVKKYIIKLELTNEKRKNISLKKIAKIKDDSLRNNIIIRPLSKNKLIVETKEGTDLETTKKNMIEYKKIFKNLFYVNEDKDRLNKKIVYVIYIGTLKSEKEKGYILRNIKDKNLKKDIQIKKFKKRYVATSKYYEDFNQMKKDLKKYKRYFKGAYYKKEIIKKDEK